jgi:hypothetical protein
LRSVYDVVSRESTSATAIKAVFNKGYQSRAVGPCDRGRTNHQNQHVPVRLPGPDQQGT